MFQICISFFPVEFITSFRILHIDFLVAIFNETISLLNLKFKGPHIFVDFLNRNTHHFLKETFITFYRNYSSLFKEMFITFEGTNQIKFVKELLINF